MKPSRRPPTALLLAAPLLAGLSLLEPLAPTGDSAGAPRLLTAGPAQTLVQLDTAAEAVRRGDFASARAAIEPLTEPLDTPTAVEARLLLGLYAHATGEPVLAYELLGSTDGYEGRFGDWRLLSLAESAEEAGVLPAAQQAWSRLLSLYPDSPLRWTAFERAAALAVTLGEPARALDLIEQARREVPARELAEGLEERSWHATEAPRHAELRGELARRLLVEQPLAASKLEVVEVLRRPDGKIEWERLFSPEELTRRARHLLDVDVQRGAIEALDAVPASARDGEWSLLMAEAEIDSHLGPDALRRLERLAVEPVLAARREWLLARAAIDASRFHRGRVNLPTSQRQAMATRAREHLWRVTTLDPPADLELRALRTLVARLDDDVDADEARRAMAALRQADPADTLGADYLWELGWEAYEARRFEEALARWDELIELYPASSSARSGRYWSARTYDRRGETRRAQEIYREVAAVEVDDFYRRHALRYLEGAASAAPRTLPDLEWPHDPRLDRARLLSDLGLDAAARVEIAGLAPSLDERAREGLEALVLARQGLRRDSIQALRRVFPVLGTVHQNRAPMDALHLYYPLDFREIIERSARDQGIEPTVILAMIRQESAFDTGAHSHAGARGLMQVMPATGRELARKLGLSFHTSRLLEPDFSVQLGTAYFRQVLSLFDGNQELALAGYNGGPYRIRRLWREAAGRVEIDHFVEGLDIPETRSYVKRVLLLADSYRRLYG